MINEKEDSMNRELIEKRIEARPDIQHGKPCIKGTRVPVYAVLEALAMGLTPEKTVKEYAPLTLEDVRACVLYAALLANEQEVVAA